MYISTNPDTILYSFGTRTATPFSSEIDGKSGDRVVPERTGPATDARSALPPRTTPVKNVKGSTTALFPIIDHVRVARNLFPRRPSLLAYSLSRSPEKQATTVETQPHPDPTVSPLKVLTSSIVPDTPAQSAPATPVRKPTKKALLIGLRYSNRGKDEELMGTHSDVEKMKRFLIERCSFPPQNITTLMDGPNTRGLYPKANDIKEALEVFVRGAQSDDTLFLLFCGHGFRVLDEDGDEEDGFDEVILGTDYAIGDVLNPKTGKVVSVATEGYVTDDYLYHVAIKLPPRCRFIAVFDSCHSGTALDLPKERTFPWCSRRTLPPETVVVCSNEATNRSANFMRLPHATTGTVTDEGITPASPTPTYAPGTVYAEPVEYCSSDEAPLKVAANRQPTVELNIRRPGKRSIAENLKDQYPTLISWSACADHQSTFEDVKGNGVLVKAFIASLTKNPRPTYMDLLRDLTVESFTENKALEEKLRPRPQLGSLFEIGEDEIFVLCDPPSCALSHCARRWNEGRRRLVAYTGLALVACFLVMLCVPRFALQT